MISSFNPRKGLSCSIKGTGYFSSVHFQPPTTYNALDFDLLGISSVGNLMLYSFANSSHILASYVLLSWLVTVILCHLHTQYIVVKRFDPGWGEFTTYSEFAKFRLYQFGFNGLDLQRAESFSERQAFSQQLIALKHYIFGTC